MIVLDASAVIDLLLDTPPHSESVRAHLREHPVAHVPRLVDAEVGQALRRHVLHAEPRPSRARVALEHLEQLPLRRYPHGPLLNSAFEMRRNMTVHDALYVVLASALGGVLVTRDASLARAARRHTAVELLRP